MSRRRARQNAEIRNELRRQHTAQLNGSENTTVNVFQNIRNEMINIALTRFKWVNLPKTCDERFLEYNLLMYGYATIAFPKSQPGMFFSTQAVIEGAGLNLYYNPRKWRSYGLNGWSFYCDNKNGVFIYDNRNRTSILPAIDFYAHEIADLYATKRQNRFHQKIPYFLETPQEQELVGNQVIKSIAGGDVAVLTTEGFTESMKPVALSTNVQFIGKELQADIQATWNSFYQTIGIKNLPFKTERQTADEVQSYEQQADLRALSALQARRDACEMLNDRFAEYLPATLTVIQHEDNISDNINYQNNMEAQAEDDIAR